MGLEGQAADVGAPRAYDAANPASGVYSRPTSTTAVRYALPDGWRGNFVAFAATGADAFVYFGSSTIAITGASDSSVVASGGTETLTPIAGTGWPVAAGTEAHFRVPNDPKITHFAVVGSAAGRWYARIAQGLGG